MNNIIPNKIYLVWQNAFKDDPGYFLQFNSIEDAIFSEGEKTVVYSAEPKLLGQFKKQVKFVKVRKRKRKK